MQTEASQLVNSSAFFDEGHSQLHDAFVAGKFDFRQGLWIEDLRIPPGQECSNGSMILLAVVLWRTFALVGRERRARRLPMRYETP
jgi:hypothetical protein